MWREKTSSKGVSDISLFPIHLFPPHLTIGKERLKQIKVKISTISETKRTWPGKRQLKRDRDRTSRGEM
jgi:hypothetical protein